MHISKSIRNVHTAQRITLLTATPCAAGVPLCCAAGTNIRMAPKQTSNGFTWHGPLEAFKGSGLYFASPHKAIMENTARAAREAPALRDSPIALLGLTAHPLQDVAAVVEARAASLDDPVNVSVESEHALALVAALQAKVASLQAAKEAAQQQQPSLLAAHNVSALEAAEQRAAAAEAEAAELRAEAAKLRAVVAETTALLATCLPPAAEPATDTFRWTKATLKSAAMLPGSCAHLAVALATPQVDAVWRPGDESSLPLAIGLPLTSTYAVVNAGTVGHSREAIRNRMSLLPTRASLLQ